jgi:ankyrin repeat protein
MTYRGAQNLIKRGDEAGLRQALDTGLDPNLVNQNGWTLLMLAAVEGDVRIGRLLIEKGAVINTSNNKEDSAHSLATNRGHALFVDLLNEAAAT